MKNKEDYFEPNIEDIRIGYECEICPNKGYDDNWIPIVGKCEESPENGVKSGNLDDLTYDCLIDRHVGIRTQYLTKEQIVAEGWIQLTDTCFKKDKIHLDFSYKDGIEVHLGEGTYLFQGDCKDINTFRYIIKLLNI